MYPGFHFGLCPHYTLGYAGVSCLRHSLSLNTRTHQSATFRLLEYIQSEVHRFAITFHRDVRSKSQIASRLDYIKGIGPKTKDELMQHFHSLKRLSKASLEELQAIVGRKKALLLYEEFHKS